MILKNLYDSHVHLLPTGEVSLGLHLGAVRTQKNLRNIPIKPSYQREDWIVGFGWDENNFEDLALDAKCLDEVFPDKPVFFSRVDGHSSWLNTQALKRLHLQEKFPQGVLKETDHIEALLSLPPFSSEQKLEFIQEAVRIFNRQGFTHIRDMGSTQEQFLLCKKLEEADQLSLHIQHNFVCENRQDFSRAIAEMQKCRSLESELLKVNGIKIFLDGSLGSETAYLSVPYGGKEQRGILNWDLNDLEEVMKETWSQGFEVSVHTLGDEAAHQVVQLARKIYAENISGVLNLEHVEVLRPETIQAMKSLHIVCHMQPCHWLSDQKWLKTKLKDLQKWAFPWESLRNAKVNLFFGSDSPIEPPILKRNLQALEESQKSGIKAFRGDIFQHHCCQKWNLPDTYTIYENFEVQEVYFKGKKII